MIEAVHCTLPLRLGFWLEQQGAQCFGHPEILYCGIDRLPSEGWYYGEEGIRWILGEVNLPGNETGELTAAWDAYSEADHSGDLHVDLRLALRLQDQFRRIGIELDLIYAELTEMPEHVESYPSGDLWTEVLAHVLPPIEKLHNRLGQRPSQLRFLGYDLSHPAPTFHSAICQPGLEEIRPDYPHLLNESGLFGGRDSALVFLEAANQMDYGPLPFCVIGVWEPT